MKGMTCHIYNIILYRREHPNRKRGVLPVLYYRRTTLHKTSVQGKISKQWTKSCFIIVYIIQLLLEQSFSLQISKAYCSYACHRSGFLFKLKVCKLFCRLQFKLFHYCFYIWWTLSKFWISKIYELDPSMVFSILS